jgi:hypothetical protein
MLFNQGRNAVVVDQRGETVALDSLTGAQRDQVYLSLCLALLTTASRHGVWLPLVLDDPFERLDARATAALAAVLEGFGRQGHQVLLFTQRKDAAERLASVGAEISDIVDLRRTPVAAVVPVHAALHHESVVRETPMKKRRIDEATGELRRRKKKPASASHNGASRDPGHSDAA